MITPHIAFDACRPLLTGVLGLAAVASLFAQEASSPQPPVEETSIVLNPFVVTSGRDVGYQSSNSVTATRVNRSIIETPLAISVLNSDFLRDTSSTSRLDEIFRYVPNAQGDARTDSFTRGIFGSDNGSMRGFPVNAILRNGVSRSNNFSLRNVARVELLRGPVSVFFGSAQPGGTINYITAKPEFRRFAETMIQYGRYVSRYDSEETDTGGYEGSFTYNDHVGQKLAYRLFAFGGDRNGWHDREYFREKSFAPSVLWKPLNTLSVTVEGEYLNNRANPAGATAVGNKQYGLDYASPPADVLAFNNLTAAQYRAAIFGNSNRWMDLTVAARGNSADVIRAQNLYRNSGLSDQYPAGNPGSNPAFNFQGRGHYQDQETKNVSTEIVFSPFRFVTLRYNGVYSHLDYDWIYTFRSEHNGDYTWNLAASQGAQQEITDRNQQIDALFNHELWGVKHQLLVGYDYYSNASWSRSRNFDYSSAKPMVDRNGNTWTGIEVYRRYDPVIHGLVPLSLSDAVSGFQTPTSGEVHKNGVYATWQGEFTLLGHKLIPSAGYREERQRSDNVSQAGVLTKAYSKGPSSTYGLLVELRKGLNAYASYSENYQPNNGLTAVGPGLNRDINGNVVAGLNEAVPVEDQTGKGTDIGLKFNNEANTISGTLAWFQVDRAGILLQDSERTNADPRNRLGTMYPDFNGQLRLVDAGFIPVRFFTTSGAQRNEGVELELLWTPVKNFQLLGSLSNIYKSVVLENKQIIEPERGILFNRRLAKSPEYQFGFWGKYSFTDGAAKGFSIGLGVRGQTATIPRTDSYRDADDFHAGYVALDGNVSYSTKHFGQEVTYMLAGSNLTDKLYGYGNFAYADPRRVTLSVRLKL